MRVVQFFQFFLKSNLLLLFIGIVAILWLVIPNDNKSSFNFQAAKHPQEYMNNVSMWSYTETGALKNELHAKEWAYLPETKSSTLIEPHLTVYKPDQSVWHIDAKSGKVSQPTIGVVQEIELNDNVVIERPAMASIVPIKLETSKIRYQPKAQYAETDQFVTMMKPGLKITGIGLRAFLDKSFVELLHNVKTQYVASQR